MLSTQATLAIVFPAIMAFLAMVAIIQEALYRYHIRSQHTVNVDSEAQNTPPVSPAPETSPNNTEEVPSVVRSMNEMELGHIPRRASDPGLSSERIDAPGKTARVIEQDVLPNSNLHGDVVREPVARESGAGSE